jgi:hypothetical protein
MPDPPLPKGDRPGGVRGDTSRGAGALPASPRWVGLVSGTREDKCTCG